MDRGHTPDVIKPALRLRVVQDQPVTKTYDVDIKLSMIGRHVLSDASIAPADEYNGCY